MIDTMHIAIPRDNFTVTRAGFFKVEEYAKQANSLDEVSNQPLLFQPENGKEVRGKKAYLDHPPVSS